MKQSAEPISLVHHLPGRLRVRVPALQQHDHYASWFRQQLLILPGVTAVRLRPAACSAVLEYDDTQTDQHQLLAQLQLIDWQQASAGDYETEYCGGDNLLNLAGLALSWLLPAKYAAIPSLLLTAPVLSKGLHTLAQRKLKVEVLDALAIGLSVVRGDYRTAMLTQTLLTLGEYMEQQTSRHSDSLLASLMQPQQHPVWVERNGERLQISSAELLTNDTMLLGPGDNIPADGHIIQGVGLINQASMTGESVPVRRESGAWLYAGTAVQEGNLRVRAERVGDDSSTANIRRFISDSLNQRSETQQVTHQMADRRVAITLAVGVLVFALTRDWQRLASVFLVDYSCALKLSTPIAFKSIMYRAARNGLLLKGGRAIEQLATVDTVVFDKTGTLTYGDMLVTDVISFDHNQAMPSELLAIAASVEEHSNHPLARAVVAEARHQALPHINHGEVEYIIAHGLQCQLDSYNPTVNDVLLVNHDHPENHDRTESKLLAENCSMTIGSRHFLSCHYQIDFAPYETQIRQLQQQGKHLLFIGFGNRLVGMIGLQDKVRSEAREIIARLRACGISQVVLLTGDQQEKAQQLAAELEIDQVFAEATPENKTDVVRNLQQQGRKVLFIGDGVNDAPVLTQADVGLAMNQSTELAQQTADAVLLQDNLYGVVTARELSQQAMKLVNSNIRITEWVNSSIMLAAAFARINPGASALLHNGTTLGVLLRSLAAKKDKN